MPKRSFDAIEDDTRNQCPQMKIHIGPKEVVQKGACGQKSLSAVHSKTLALLYAGSRHCFSSYVHEPANSLTSRPVMSFESTTCQVEISSSGHLVSHKQTSANVKLLVQASSNCPSCNTSNCVMFERCGFCESFNCSSCLNACVGCGHEYCPKCSITLYSPIEGRICFTCATEKPHH